MGTENVMAVSVKKFAGCLPALLCGSFLLALLCAYIPSSWAKIAFCRGFVELVNYFVPSIVRLSSKSIDPDRYDLVLSSQWVLAPLYALIFFAGARPSSPERRSSAIIYFSSHRRPNKFWLAVGVAIMIGELAASGGIIPWASIYNGGYISDYGSPISEIFYSSRLFLAIYAWASGYIDVLFLWLLVVILLNLKLLFGEHAQQKGQA